MDPTDPIHATLTELAALGLRAARVVTCVMEIEQRAAQAAAAWLPPAQPPASLAEAQAAGQGADMAAAALAGSVPRIDALGRTLERVSRSVRRTAALLRRMEAGWPRAGADTRPAMVRRQVARGVAAAIRREHDGEAAERLFDELSMRLDDPALAEQLETLPVDEVIDRICHDLGLAIRTLAAHRAAGPPPRRAADKPAPPDTG